MLPLDALDCLQIYGILMQRWNGECTNDADIKARLAEVTVKADEQVSGQ